LEFTNINVPIDYKLMSFSLLFDNVRRLIAKPSLIYVRDHNLEHVFFLTGIICTVLEMVYHIIHVKIVIPRLYVKVFQELHLIAEPVAEMHSLLVIVRKTVLESLIFKT